MNHTASLSKTQDTIVLTRQEINETRELAYFIASELSERQLFTHMGVFNSLIWRAATDYQVTAKEDGVDRIVPEKWNNLLMCSVQGEVEITVPLDFTENYLKQCWKGAFYNKTTLLTYRKQQMSWGLFTYDLENRPKGAAWGSRNNVSCQGIATPPRLEKLDIARMLIFYQMFDQIRRNRINAKLKDPDDSAFSYMPDHGGMLMVELYNALFLGISEFHGACLGARDIVIQAIDSLPATKVVIWKWKFKETPHNKESQHLYRSMWRNMVERAGFVAQQAIKIVTDLVTEPLGDMADVPF